MKNMRLRDWMAFVAGAYVGQKLVVGALKKILPHE